MNFYRAHFAAVLHPMGWGSAAMAHRGPISNAKNVAHLLSQKFGTSASRLRQQSGAENERQRNA